MTSILKNRAINISPFSIAEKLKKEYEKISNERLMIYNIRVNSLLETRGMLLNERVDELFQANKNYVEKYRDIRNKTELALTTVVENLETALNLNLDGDISNILASISEILRDLCDEIFED